MSEDAEESKGLSIPINSKTIGTIITVVVLVSGVIGTWYVNNERVSDLEAKVTAIEDKKLKEVTKAATDAVDGAKKSLKEEVARVEKESKERHEELKKESKENLDHLNNKMEQIEDVVHNTQLAVGTISQDIKNVSNNIDEMKEDMKSIRNSVRRRGR